MIETKFLILYLLLIYYKYTVDKHKAININDTLNLREQTDYIK